MQLSASGVFAKEKKVLLGEKLWMKKMDELGWGMLMGLMSEGRRRERGDVEYLFFPITRMGERISGRIRDHRLAFDCAMVYG